jgi:hypothetical protein
VWPGMLGDVTRYINTCKSCRLQKRRVGTETGALSSLPIPPQRWQVVQADWIVGLPVTEDGFDATLVIEDRLTKYAYFIPAKSSDTAEISAKRAFGVVFCVHGVPETLVSDRDSKFTSSFFGSLMALMHVKQSMGTSHYHDFNGALECLNKTVEVMLRHLMAEFPDRDFDELLPMAQWAYNTAVHRSINMSPYVALFGVEPQQPMNFVVTAGVKLHPATKIFAELQQGVLVMARDALFKAQETMLAYENRARRDTEFKVGEHVFLSTVNLGSSHFDTTVKKMRPSYVGPFKVQEQCSLYTYRLVLPHTLKSVHPVFHVGLLWRAIPTPVDMAGRLGAGVEFPAPEGPHPEEGAGLLTHDDNGVPVYVIESVRARERRRNGFNYLVRWRGWPNPEDDSWITRKDAETSGALRLLREFDATLVSAAAK